MSSQHEKLHAPPAAVEERAFEELLDYIRRARGFDFTAYKRPSLIRRVRKRMDMVSVHGFVDYVDYLEAHPDEFHYLFNTILFGATAFCRAGAPGSFRRSGSPPLPRGPRGPGDTIRVWSAG